MRYSLKQVLAVTFACNRQWGWVSQKKAQENPRLIPTSEYVLAVLCGRVEVDVTTNDHTLASRVSWWAESFGMNELRTTYYRNIHDLVLKDVVGVDDIGRAASMVSAWQHVVAPLPKSPQHTRV